MLQIAREYFQELHTPIRPTLLCHDAQQLLLNEVQVTYSDLIAPPSSSGPFSLEEVIALKEHMPGMAPGPDGIPYTFYKSLARILDNPEYPNKITQNLPSLWDSFRDLSDDIRSHGPD